MIYVEAKTILSASNSVNLYRGCPHGCIYCDTRSSCYQVKHFDEIEVKRNAINIFEMELRKKRNKVLVRTGSMCDPYLPLEKDLELTKQMLEKIYQYGHGVYMLTKSDLILRDLELFKCINERNKAIVCLTLTTMDDEVCKIVEPNVALTSRRLEVLKKFSEANIMTGVWLCPLLPFINDDEKNLISLIKAMSVVGVKFIVCFAMGLTLRDGNRQYYYQQLDKYFPGLKEKYIAKYGDSYIINSPNEKRLFEILKKECERYGIIYDHNMIAQMIDDYHSNQQLALF